MPIALVAVAVAAAGAAASTAVKREGERKAIHAQQDALKEEKDINIQKEQRLAQSGDMEHYIKSQAFFREQNPELAEARDLAAQQLLTDLQTGGQREEKVLDQMFEGYLEPGATDAFAEEIRQQAAEDLALGSQLPADYQAELVRLGLEESGQAGIGYDPSGAVTQKLGTLVGQAGLNLRQRRLENASAAANLSDTVRSNRARILSGLIDANQGVRAFQTGQATNAMNIARAETPSIGLRGRDLVNFDLKNLYAKNKRLREMARLEAENKLSESRAHAGYIQAGTQAAQGALGVAGGGGGMGGMGGQAFSGTMMGGGGAQQVVYSPSYGTVSAAHTGGPATINRTPAQWNNFYRDQAMYE